MNKFKIINLFLLSQEKNCVWPVREVLKYEEYLNKRKIHLIGKYIKISAVKISPLKLIFICIYMHLNNYIKYCKVVKQTIQHFKFKK